jgi:hypothetical protein
MTIEEMSLLCEMQNKLIAELLEKIEDLKEERYLFESELERYQSMPSPATIISGYSRAGKDAE